MLKIISFLLVCLMASAASAGFVTTTFKSTTLNQDLPTRILIAGGGDDLGTLFQEVAKAKALKYQEQSSDYQIVFISAIEPDLDNKALLERWGFTIQNEKKSTFDGEVLVKELLKFKKIASIDVFSHSSAQYGVHLDSKIHRMNENTRGVEKLKGHFLKDAYTYLHGCNTGFNLAPFLAKTWEIPVAGSMTSTNFQKLHSDGNFYLSEEGFAPNADWATTNSKSYVTPVDCREGACQRLKPDNHPYVGFWGDYGDGGLPFYKFFCPKNSAEDCKRVMAKALLSFNSITTITATSSLSEYKKVVVDFLCPISAKGDLRKECETSLESALLSGDQTYNPFARDLIECNFESCQAEVVCKEVAIFGIKKPGTCELINHFDGKATTLVREYKAYIEGFSSLNK